MWSNLKQIITKLVHSKTICYFLIVPFRYNMQQSESESRYCQEAVDSAKSVTSCPTSKAEWDDAARRKNCSSIASKQNCSLAEHFQYHCVINEFRNELLEVCAPSRIIFGKGLTCMSTRPKRNFFHVMDVQFLNLVIIYWNNHRAFFLYVFRKLRRIQCCWWSNSRSVVSSLQRNISEMRLRLFVLECLLM